jgi:hypothetical protein
MNSQVCGKSRYILLSNANRRAYTLWIRKPADGAGCLDVFLPGVVKMLPHYMNKPVKAGAFFLDVRDRQQKADQVHEILNRIQAIVPEIEFSASRISS